MLRVAARRTSAALPRRLGLGLGLGLGIPRRPQHASFLSTSTEGCGSGSSSRGGGFLQRMMFASPLVALVAIASFSVSQKEKDERRRGMADFVLGAQLGDEGKGKFADGLEQLLGREYALCVRCNGGNNAGHQVWHGGVKVATNLIPSGALTPHITGVLGNGTVVDAKALLAEIDRAVALSETADTNASLSSEGADFLRGLRDIERRVFISDRATLLFPELHATIDRLQEERRAASVGGRKLGTTGKGIGPAYASQVSRSAVRAGDLKYWSTFEARYRALAADLVSCYPELVVDVEAELKNYRALRERLLPMVVDSVELIHSTLKGGKRVVVEGANATGLDKSFGTFPFVTSSGTCIGGALEGIGVSHLDVGDVVGIVKAYLTRVGEGPFPTELLDAIGERLRKVGREFGTTTGRPRRCGWLDVPMLLYAVKLNGFTALNLTKLDVLTGLSEVKIAVRYLTPEGVELRSVPANLTDLQNVKVEYETLPGWTEDISRARRFEDLPVNAQRYVRRVEQLVGVPIRWIGVGPNNDDMVTLGPGGVSGMNGVSGVRSTLHRLIDYLPLSV